MTQFSYEHILDTLTLEEQVSLLSGADFWSVGGLPEKQVGVLHVTDGPNGARGSGGILGKVKSTCFPAEIALGASWDPDLVADIGSALASEVKAKGAHVLLAPTVNIQRGVTNGRNFECFSEDPVLTTRLAVAYIKALQADHIGATIKHFVGNDSEFERHSISSQIDERTLREVYLMPFEAAVKEAGTWAVMSSYNRLNGIYTSDSEWLLTTVLRQQWGFDGVVISDWFGSYSTALSVKAGLDIEMPGPVRDRGEKLVKAVHNGEVSRDVVRERAGNVLKLMQRTGALDNFAEREEYAQDMPQHRKLIRRAGAQAAVLLKNVGILPLDPARLSRVAVIGPNAKEARVMGGGSAQLNVHYAVSPHDGLAAVLDPKILCHAAGCTNYRYQPILRGNCTVDFFASPDLSGEAVHSETLAEATDFLVGDVADGKVDNKAFSLRLKTQFTPDSSGLHQIGVIAAGLARVHLDGKLVCDAWSQWKRGTAFFERGCAEVIADIDLQAGRSYQIEMEFSSLAEQDLGLSAYRLGISRQLGDADISAAVECAAGADVALVFAGRSGDWDTEGTDLPDITLPGRQDELIRAVAAANANTIVVLQSGGPVEMPWLNEVKAVLQAWYPGQECGNAIADVLFGKAEPEGRLPQTFPVKMADNPTYSGDPEIYPGAGGKVRYAEGVFVGYRHYERADIAPAFPFGFGLGYTQFEITGFSADASAFESDAEVTVEVTVRNSGERRGATVVQLYVADAKAMLERPAKELKSFTKLRLDPGETHTVTLTLSGRDFAFFDPEQKCWVLEAGEFDLLVGFSALDIRHKTTVTLAQSRTLPV